MSRRRDIRRAKRRYRNRDQNEDVNPMHYVSNLVDAMLVLAVGIMLALVINWKIDVSSSKQASQAGSSQVPTFEDDNLQSVDESSIKDKDKLKKSGSVYYDPETKTYYVMKE